MEPFRAVANAGGVQLAGDLDLRTVIELDAVFAKLSGDVIVECTDLDFIDSAGFYCLDRGYNAAVARQATFEVAGFSTFQRRVARILSVPYVGGSGEAA